MPIPEGLLNGQMHREHVAWLSVCRELKNASASLDLNEENALHAALVLWGEELFWLRRHQDEDTINRATEYARELYGQHIGFLPY